MRNFSLPVGSQNSQAEWVRYLVWPHQLSVMTRVADSISASLLLRSQRLALKISLVMEFNPSFACDQLNSTNHSALFEAIRQFLVSILSAYFDRVYAQLYVHGHITFKNKKIHN